VNKIDIFIQLVRDASILRGASPENHTRAMAYLMLNSRQLINYISTTDFSFESLVREYLDFCYNAGPKPNFLTQNAL